MPHADFGDVAEEDLLLLADAQTSGGLLIAGEIPGAPIIGELRAATGATVTVH
jgi:selenide,water dikinase